MATLTYSASNANPDAFASFFLLQSQNNTFAPPTPTSATVALERVGFFSGTAIFNYVLTQGATSNPSVVSFTLKAPNAPSTVGNVPQLLSFDAGPGNASIALHKPLQNLYSSNPNTAVASAALLLAGNDTITSSGPTGRLLTGFAGNDIIRAGTGRDQIDGGAGADTMLGGAGNDDYLVDSALDKVSELANQGFDVIYAKASFKLPGGSHLEEMRAQAPTGAISLTGNELVNKLFGNNSVNVLDGGKGADRMEGFAGNDVYYIDNASDQVIEAPSTAQGANDTIRTTISYVLSQGLNVETLQAIGTANVNLTGNFLNNTLIGNAGNNRLDGDSGFDVGFDILMGRGGNDLYIIDFPGDVVSEVGGSGIDTVHSAITWSLANPATTKGAVENLTLTGNQAINGTGNGLNNIIIGNARANVLEGGAGIDTINGNAGNDKLNGGLGNDKLTGGVGNDIFVFSTALNAATNLDSISDFNSANDTFHLDNAVFAKLTAVGGLNAQFFKAGAAAADGNDFIVYNQATGALIYDSNGNGAGAAVQFATLLNKPVLTAADFVVI
jgi:Ca2+-binding RTX toxin-like protein